MPFHAASVLAATVIAVEGDVAAAANVLKLEGCTPGLP
jgi:hypothetical protein